MDNYGKVELEILEMEVKKGDRGNKYVEFSGKSTKTDEVFTGLKAVGITGANLVKDFRIGDVVTIQHTLEVNYDEDKNIEMNILGVGLSGEITECNTGFLRGILAYDPKKKKSKGKDISEIFVRVIKRDFKGNVVVFEGDNGKEITSRQMFKLRLTQEEHIDLMLNEIGKREKSCAADSELFIEYELEPNKEEGFVNIIPTHLSVLSLDSIMDSDNWEIPSIKSKKSKSKEVDYEDMDHDELVELAEKAGIEDADDYGKKILIKKLKELDKKKSKSKEVDYEDMDHDELVELAEKAGIEDADDYGKKTLIKKLKELDKKKSKKSSKSKEVDYEDMDHDELVELAEKAGIEDADDYGKKTLIKKLKELDEKKSKKSDDTPDFGEKYTEKYGYNDEDEEPAFPE